MQESGYGSEYRESPVEHPCLALKKLLGGGSFYYSVDFDLTNRLQNRCVGFPATSPTDANRDSVSEESAFDLDSLDDAFLWNSYMIEPLIQFRSRLTTADRISLDASHILTSAIRGYAATMTVPANSAPLRAFGSKLPSMLTIISRLSCRRAGTRFNSRGIDDDGNVANFVETETIYHLPPGLCFSYSQVRGSVPIFWEQASGLLPQQQKIQITRSPEATQPAFDKHFQDLELKYGNIHVLNLLSESKPNEVGLTARYNLHIEQCSLNRGLARGAASNQALLQASQFDFHAETGEAGYEAAKSIRHLIQHQVDGNAYFLAEGIQGFDNAVSKSRASVSVTLQQGGVFRTNCLDCLDRTNLIQTIISQMALVREPDPKTWRHSLTHLSKELFFRHKGEYARPDYWTRHATLWADNGDVSETPMWQNLRH